MREVGHASPSHPLLQGLFLRRLRRNILIRSFVICDGEALMKNIMRMFYRPIRLSSKKSVNRLFVEEWEKEFGENTYYLSDSFNENGVAS